MKRSNEEVDKIFASLKLIECLFHRGMIKQHVFLNILNDYKDCVDVSQFRCYNLQQEEDRP